MWLVLTKRGGFKKSARVEEGQVGDKMREIRAKALSEKREKMAQQGPGQRAAGATRTPECYAELDFADQEEDLRKAVTGPDH